MQIQFDKMEPVELPRFRGGEKHFTTRMHADANCKIMHGTLIPGASIGIHWHETSAEMIYILSGRGYAICDGKTEPLAPGGCHYCPKGSFHGVFNDGKEDLVFFAVVPQW